MTPTVTFLSPFKPRYDNLRQGATNDDKSDGVSAIMHNTLVGKGLILTHQGVDLVAGLGFEPRQTDPESVVLPLHYPAR